MHRLTPRQREIAIAVADGLSNKEIATRLRMSDYTVRDHVSVILRKFGAPRRARLAALVSPATSPRVSP